MTHPHIMSVSVAPGKNRTVTPALRRRGVPYGLEEVIKIYLMHTRKRGRSGSLVRRTWCGFVNATFDLLHNGLVEKSPRKCILTVYRVAPTVLRGYWWVRFSESLRVGANSSSAHGGYSCVSCQGQEEAWVTRNFKINEEKGFKLKLGNLVVPKLFGHSY